MNASQIKCRRIYTVKCPGTMSGDFQVRVIARPDAAGWVRVRDMETSGIYCTHISHLEE